MAGIPRSFWPICIGIALILSCALGGAQEGSPMFRRDLGHTGAYPSGGGPAIGGVRWKIQTDGPVRSTPAVAGGHVYFGSSDGHVYAVDLDGKLLWKTDIGGAVTSSPAVANGHVFVQNRFGEVAALAAADGAVVWKSKTGQDAPLAWGFESGDLYVSSPTVTNGKVVAGSGDGQIWAFDEQSGKPLWQVKTGGRVRSSPAVSNGVAYIGSLDGSVYAVEVSTGRLVWRFDTKGRGLDSARYGFDRKSVQFTPAVADGLVYVGARDGILYAIDATSGREKWRSDQQTSWVTTPAVADGLVFAPSSDARFVQAVYAKTGIEAWRVPMPAPVWSPPAVADGLVYVGDFLGILHALDAKSGKERWTYRLDGAILGGAVPVPGGLLVGSGDGALYALNTTTGAPLKRAVFWDPAFVKATWASGHEAVRDALAAHSYQVTNAAALEKLMASAVADKSADHTLVVFAMDHLPAQLAGKTPSQGPLRRFLEAGGKVVWTGMPPLLWPRDPQTGNPGGYDKMNRPAVQDLLGVDYASANFDSVGAAPTAEGKLYGLQGWWTAAWGVAPAGVTEVLAKDENGLAAAWVKQYGGGPGTGFVMVGHNPGGASEPGLVLAVAEHRPR
jgi:outer membrane protein assembly factor BamB